MARDWKKYFVSNNAMLSISKSNKLKTCKNNYPLKYIFHLLISKLFFVYIFLVYWILISLTWYYLIPNI